MLKRLFSLSNGALLVALSLSTIAAWYSIIGLTAIFAGAVVPIIIMGTALEFAKITTTVWLRKYWHRCSWVMKVYLVPAVVLLALLTSMGIFGFLSKAHLDQNIGSGDVQAQVSLLDEKISTQRENVRSAKAMLAQMDQQVNDIMTKGDSEKSVERSVMIRKQQAKERASLQKDIEVANKEIQKLNEERAPIASELRKVEAEVGPIKYIAALIYGDNPDANVLERAVRWVIILLVSVFDPLAIMLVLAANQSKEWDDNIEEELELKEEVAHEKVMEELQPIVVAAVTIPEPEDLTDINHELAEARVIEEPFIEVPVEDTRTIAEKHPYLNKPFKHFGGLTPIVATKETPEPEVEVVEVADDGVDEGKFLEDFDANLAKGHETESPILTLGIDEVERPGDYITTPEEVSTALPEECLPEKINNEYVIYNGKPTHVNALRGYDPDLYGLITDTLPNISSGFGQQFPSEAKLGDVFVRVDSIPHRTFKYNGKSWIEAPQTSAHLSNEKYLQFLIQKISTGEYDPEMLTADQQDALETHMKHS